MTASGWIFLGLSWGLVIGVSAWCIRRILTSPRHWTEPEKDIRELHHGEFGDS